MVDADEVSRALELHARATCLWPAEAVHSALDRLAAEVTERLETHVPVLLCLMNGGVYPTGQLMDRLRFPLELDYVHATRYRGDTEGGAIEWRARPRIPLAERSVLLVDDILDEGYTLAAVQDYCHTQGAREVSTLVLVEKQHDRCIPEARRDFVGLPVPDRYVYGAGMDYHGLFRNQAAVYALPDER